jgi:uncharacterized membrane protein YhaH (DUF805 family)
MKVITIGRTPANNDIVIHDEKVSRNHLQIIRDGGSYRIVDFNSTNGTYVNGVRIYGETVLNPNDIVCIGDTMLPWQTYFAAKQPVYHYPPPPPVAPQYAPAAKSKPMFRHPFSFTGRIRRTEYGLSVIIVYVYAFIIGTIWGVIIAATATTYSDSDPDGFEMLLMYVFLIPAYWLLWAQGAKRCHDRNHSGWYQLIPFYVIWMLFVEGDRGENNYGEPAK